MSKALVLPTVITPISTNSCTAWLSSPAAMKIRATPVQRKKRCRLMTRAPR